MRRAARAFVFILLLHSAEPAFSYQDLPGTLRGVVLDADWGDGLRDVKVEIVQANQSTNTGDGGRYFFAEVPPGSYTVIFTKTGYSRQIESNVVVLSGQETVRDGELAVEFVEMDEVIVQDVLALGAGGEAFLLNLRFDSSNLLDSIGSDLMSRAGLSDAADAMRLVAGASVQDGKFAVVRGLPDRYVVSSLNGVRLPTADEDKRAVQLDQYPAAVIESVQVKKTFTPDLQGDASGGAVDIRLKQVPEETTLKFSSQVGLNTNTAGGDFLKSDGPGVDFWGSRNSAPQAENTNWSGPVGTRPSKHAPIDYKWSLSGGGKKRLDSDWTLGAFGSFFYERDSSYHDNGVDNSLWVESPGDAMTPKKLQDQGGDFKTAMFDVTKSTQSVSWGGLGVIGLESDRHKLGLNYLQTHVAEDKAILAEDTRGKAHFFPGYDVTDPEAPGNQSSDVDAAPYIRTETLEYSERTTQSLQLTGEHTFDLDSRVFGDPKLAWTVAESKASLWQPDKRQFGELWQADSYNPGAPPFTPPFIAPAVHLPFKPGANFNLGNLQRIWKDIEEESTQYSSSVNLPFDNWNEREGSLEFGVFDDSLTRDFDQDTYSNFGDTGASYTGEWEDRWSQVFPFENHPITGGETDVDYIGDQDIQAWYGMADMPLSEDVSLVGGVRWESTKIGIANVAEDQAFWYPTGATAPVQLTAGAADVSFGQDDVLPALGFQYDITDDVMLRGAYSETIARQTFKELTPILQQEFLGGPVFIGNPGLGMSSVENFDLRLDYRPYEGGLWSVSWFKKNIEDPIEYVQRVVTFDFTTPVNYPDGELERFEFELRHELGRHWDWAEGFSTGLNMTFIDSTVVLPEEEALLFQANDILAPMFERDMTNAPEHLFNLFLTYDNLDTGTQVGLFYTLQGDTLLAGADATENFIPSVYATEFDSLNFTLKQELTDRLTLKFQAKNLTDPLIDTVYRSEYIGPDVLKTSYTRGIDFALSFNYSFGF